MVRSKLNKKKELLNTAMNQLGLGGAFNNHFFYFNSYHPKSDPRMRQEDVITLQEFIDLNKDLKTQSETFVSWRNDKSPVRFMGFEKDSITWKKIHDFLIDNGFTYKDWIQLLPNIQTSRGMRPNYSLLSKNELLQISVYKLAGLKTSCTPYRSIQVTITGDMIEHVRVKDILNINDQKFTEFVRNHSLQHPTLKVIQNKLKEFGFTKKDGLFMKLELLPEVRTTNDYIQDLENEGYARSDAEFIINLAIQKRWFR